MNTPPVAIYLNEYERWVWHFIPDDAYEATYVHGPFKIEALAKKDRWFAERGHPSYGYRIKLCWIPGIGPLSLYPPSTRKGDK
jgi:hypothetical protein